MRSAFLILVRICLGFFGLILFGGGLAGLAVGDVMHSEAPQVGSLVLRSLDIGGIGYGLLLLFPARWLAHARWLALLLTCFALLFVVGVYFIARSHSSAPESAFAASLRFLPAIVALALAAWTIRNPTGSGNDARFARADQSQGRWADRSKS